MPHNTCTPGQNGELPYFQRLWRLLLDPDTDLRTKLERLFADETVRFDLDHAFLSRIDPETETQHFELVHNPHGSLETGNAVPLSATYCRKTVEDPEGTMVVNDALAEGWDDDPAYEEFGFGSYVGTTVTSEDTLYGTLCFANTDPRETPITAAERTLVEMFGQWLTYELDQWSRQRPRHPVYGEFVEYDLSSSQIDSAMDALRDPARRVILRTLFNNATEISIDDIVRTIDTPNIEGALHHNHLPKLESAGYLEWNRSSNTVSRGPNFFEVEPFVRLLNGYPGEFLK